MENSIEMHYLSPYPVVFGVLQTEDELKAFYREFKIPKKEQRFTNKNIGAFIVGAHTETDCALALYYPNKNDGLAPLVHECMHIVQHTWDMIGEKTRGHEAEAYLIQQVFEIAHDKIFTSPR